MFWEVGIEVLDGIDLECPDLIFFLVDFDQLGDLFFQNFHGHILVLVCDHFEFFFHFSLGQHVSLARLMLTLDRSISGVGFDSSPALDQVA